MRINHEKKLILISLIVTGLFATNVYAAIFVDTQNHWAEKEISDLSNAGIICGYPNGRFYPNRSVTRAEYASILVKSLNLQSTQVGYIPKFNDVPIDYWGYRAIDIVNSRNLIAGYPDNKFRPSKKITRAEAITAAIKSTSISIPNQYETQQILSQYYDDNQIPQWAKSYIAAAIKSGLIVPTNGQIRPNKPITRGETASLISKLRNYNTRTAYAR